MSLTFTVETGSADSDANSYTSVEFADDYIETNAFVSSDWQLLDPSEKEALLIRASRVLDFRVKWNGERVDPDSGLRWPRAGVFDRDGFEIASTIIPRALQEAVAEFASVLQKEDYTGSRAEDAFKEIRVDVIDIKFNTDFRRLLVPDTVSQILEGLGETNSGRKPAFRRVIRH